jgi:hypothetical protein
VGGHVEVRPRRRLWQHVMLLVTAPLPPPCTPAPPAWRAGRPDDWREERHHSSCPRGARGEASGSDAAPQRLPPFRPSLEPRSYPTVVFVLPPCALHCPLPSQLCRPTACQVKFVEDHPEKKEAADRYADVSMHTRLVACPPACLGSIACPAATDHTPAFLTASAAQSPFANYMPAGCCACPSAAAGGQGSRCRGE